MTSLIRPIRPMQIASGDLWAGAETQVYLSCKGLSEFASDEVDVSCFLFNSGTLADKLSEHKIKHEIQDESLGFLRLITSCIYFCKKQHSNILISHGYKEGILAFIVSTILDLKWVHVIHGTKENLSGFAALKGYLYSSIEYFLVRIKACQIVTVSKTISDELNLSHLNKITIIHNAAEHNTSQSTKSDNPIIVSWLGRLMPIKRPDLAIQGFLKFIEIAEIKSEIELHIYGTGPLKSDLESLNKNTLNVKLMGFTNTPNQVIANSDIILLTSDSEGIPTVILEAIHNKVPVVTRLVGGVKEIISAVPEYGIVTILDSSAESCARSIDFAVKNLRSLKDKAAKSNSTYFTPRRLISEQLKLLKKLI